ncbi:MAG: hypothetical protein HDR92_04655 [Bacteroides sp.]|nr:hypothetical protein [Bacteroides sp.]
MLRLLAILSIYSALVLSCSSTDWFNEPQSVAFEPDTTGINPLSRYVVVIGDIQEYTMRPDDYMTYFRESMDWLVIQQSFFNNIDAVIQVGDITNDNESWQWSNAMLAMRPVAKAMPFIAVTGNHDYDWLRKSGDSYSYITDRNSTLFDNYEPDIHKAMKVVDRFEAGSRQNAIYSLPLGSRVSLIIALEFAPRPEVLEWADRHISANKSTDCYIVTHEWLDTKGELVTDEQCYAYRQFGTASRASSPSVVWDKLVYPHDNVIAVLCGHNGFVAHRLTPNSAARNVPQILFNLQYQENGGDSMLQFWEMPQGTDSVHTYVYNTRSHERIDEPYANFSFSRSRGAAQQ